MENCYKTVIPGTVEYEAFLREVILSGDIDTMSRVKGNKYLPVHIIDGFKYGKYRKERETYTGDAIAVITGPYRKWYLLEDGRYFDWQGQERPLPVGQPGMVDIVGVESYQALQDHMELMKSAVVIPGKETEDGMTVFILPDNGRD